MVLTAHSHVCDLLGQERRHDKQFYAINNHYLYLTALMHQLKEIVLHKQYPIFMPTTFITANTETTYHTPTSSIKSSRNFHSLSRPHEVTCTYMHIGIHLCDSVYVQGKRRHHLFLSVWDILTWKQIGLHFAPNIQLFLTNSDCIMPI